MLSSFAAQFSGIRNVLNLTQRINVLTTPKTYKQAIYDMISSESESYQT